MTSKLDIGVYPPCGRNNGLFMRSRLLLTRPREEAADRADCVAAALLSRRRFQPSHTAPSLPHQVPNEHAENTGTRKRRHSEEPPALDLLENEIRRLQPTDVRKW